MSDIASLRGRQAPAIDGTFFSFFSFWAGFPVMQCETRRGNATLRYLDYLFCAFAHDRSRINEMPVISERLSLWVCRHCMCVYVMSRPFQIMDGQEVKRQHIDSRQLPTLAIYVK